MEALAYRFPRQLAPGAFHLKIKVSQLLSHTAGVHLSRHQLSALRLRWRGVGKSVGETAMVGRQAEGLHRVARN